MPRGGRRPCTRSVHWPDESAEQKGSRVPRAIASQSGRLDGAARPPGFPGGLCAGAWLFRAGTGNSPEAGDGCATAMRACAPQLRAVCIRLNTTVSRSDHSLDRRIFSAANDCRTATRCSLLYRRPLTSGHKIELYESFPRRCRKHAAPTLAAETRHPRPCPMWSPTPLLFGSGVRVCCILMARIAAHPQT
jgi:hypothetical protein